MPPLCDWSTDNHSVKPHERTALKSCAAGFAKPGIEFRRDQAAPRTYGYSFLSLDRRSYARWFRGRTSQPHGALGDHVRGHCCASFLSGSRASAEFSNSVHLEAISLVSRQSGFADGGEIPCGRVDAHYCQVASHATVRFDSCTL